MLKTLTDQVLAALAEARHGDPFAVLGPQLEGRARWITAIDPGADRLVALTASGETELPRAGGPVFCGKVPGSGPYTLRGEGAGAIWTYDDAYRFGPVLGALDEYLIGEGRHEHLWRALGAHPMEIDGTAGTHFATWAPNARRVSVVGDFNAWDGRRHPMRSRGGTGVWEIFIPGALQGAAYKFEILGPHGLVPLKADPVGFGAQHPPETASIIRDISGFGWQDAAWMETRTLRNRRDAPISIYEVHLGSWNRIWNEGGRALSYIEAADKLVRYVAEMGFTHIELMPISEYPFDGSWGYQPVGLYAPTIRFGPPHEFRNLVEAAHRAGLGVLLDWVPGHFPSDAHGLAQYDGTPLYEHADPREGFHQDWNTLIYNYGRSEVANFLTANARYWLEEYHLDGLRVDAVASMLYRDYSRDEGDWVPNRFGGRENLEAIAFLKRMNAETYGACPGIMNVAEESTSFPGVSAPVDAGGLGFGFKWNMGWMNDTLRYMAEEPVNRKWHHDLMTRPVMWAWSENFVLPISHDEVVHGKGSMLAKMPGTEWEKFANLRAYYGYMWGFPGKKLLFMGCEFGQWGEWSHQGELEWAATAAPAHHGVKQLVADLNKLYTATPALHVKDCQAEGFDWIEAHDGDQSVYAWLRFGNEGDAPCLVVCNFTPVQRPDYRLGVPTEGHWAEVLNSDASAYGGGGGGNMGGVASKPEPSHGRPASITVTLPPLSTLIFKLDAA